MSFNEILNWLMERQTIPQERRYSEHGRTDETIVKYNNGDTYHQITTYMGYGNLDKLHTEIYINGECARSVDMYYSDFKWNEVKSA